MKRYLHCLPTLSTRSLSYNRFYDLFSQGPCDEYKVFFTTEKGKGIQQGGVFTHTYEKLGFKRSFITFSTDDENAKEFQEAIASMVFYLFTMPNAFIVVKAGITGKIDEYNYFYADIFGLYDHEYVQSNDYSIKYGGKFIWKDGSGIYTQENYEIWKHKFAGIFKPIDIRHFLAFENNEGLPMIDYIMKLLNQWFRQNRNTIGVSLSSFEEIEDLRK